MIVRGLLPFENKHIRVALVRYMYGHRQGVAVVKTTIFFIATVMVLAICLSISSS